ncbi:hypothetical protein JAAARDRAFT_37736 [Jaapia argillacea MUCL 33604]|uniref:Uncharacterized protein n=1 Tax=Jaapia argillacea MUCL 33604 TaxID=933084 RepID=A0A067PV99_9AGAM|nr:hypothetical protein JAAARDRAFT_37736 [Jaapia argillacea MUCL 33604]
MSTSKALTLSLIFSSSVSFICALASHISPLQRYKIAGSSSPFSMYQPHLTQSPKIPRRLPIVPPTFPPNISRLIPSLHFLSTTPAEYLPDQVAPFLLVFVSGQAQKLREVEVVL